MEYPLVSIITSCFNGEIYLDRYFESILNQTYPHLELIFVNDGSTDQTEKIALSYTSKLKEKGISYKYIYQENSGQSVALNKGLKIFKGKYLTWPDSDDVMTDDCIAKKVEFLENHLEYKMVRSNGLFYNEETNAYRRINESSNCNKENIFEDLLVLKTYGCCGCYMITRDLFLKIYPNRMIYESREGQNWQILVPCSSYSKCGYIDENLYIIYERNTSHSRKKRSNEEEIRRLENFKIILYNAIDNSKCDKAKYKNIVDFDCARKQFYYAIADKNKKTIKEKYKLMRIHGKVTNEQRFLYLKYVVLK